jgi:chaperonin cofactor prefoldin
MKLQVVLFFILLGLVSGCATLNEKQCENPDWYHIGRADGRAGNQARYQAHVHTCSRTSDDKEAEAYLQGWNEGIVKYCTSENGYKAGAYSGNGEACDPQKYPDFTEQFKLGRTVRDLQEERADVRKRIEDVRGDQSVVAQIGAVAHMLSGTSPTADLDKKDEELGQKIRLLQNNAASNTGPTSELNYQMAAHGDAVLNYGGAIFGSVIGFGTGHAIQGRWSTDGWKWTLGEVAALGVLFGTSQDCTVTNEHGGTVQGQCANPWSVVGFLAFRVWQGYDLFHYANNSRGNLYAAPTANGLLIGYQF